MIQLNLLPDVKLEYIRTQRSRRLILSVATVVTIIAVILLAGLLVYGHFQKQHLDDLSSDITSASRRLSNQPQISRVLTVQNQLESLTTLHDAKPAVSRLFGYLDQLTPAPVSISSFGIDLTTQTVTITGSADALSSVNKYVDTLKFTTYAYTANKVKVTGVAFGNVVLTDFTLKTDEKADAKKKDNGPATYTISLAYDPAIFDITNNAKLVVPKLITTRSELEKPTDLFKAAPAPAKTATTPATTPVTPPATSTSGGSH